MTDPKLFLDGRVTLHAGDCRETIKAIASGSIDSVVTDPPYALVSIGKRFGKPGAAPAKAPEGGTGAYARASAGFMGQAWDTGETAFAVDFWAEVYRVLKPGGHVVAFSGTRTYHRMAVAIEDAGFEIRDQLAWTYGSGFPKSHDVAKDIDKRGGHHRGKRGMPKPFQSSAKGQEYERTEKGRAVLDSARAWEGWGTALKPAWEPICLARKPVLGTVADNVLAHGTGALNIDDCRIQGAGEVKPRARGDADTGTKHEGWDRPWMADRAEVQRRHDAAIDRANELGRWPANIAHDGSFDVVSAFPGADSPARFFYSAKADGDDRIGSKHPTVKPVDLMRWLVRLITPPGGLVLDPFAGTGTTGEAAYREGFRAVLCEREPDYQADIARRMALVLEGPTTRKTAIVKARGRDDGGAGPLFGGAEAVGGGGRSTAPSLTTLDRPDRSQAMSEPS